MMKPPKISPRAVYDKVDGPVYYAKGGKIYKKGYADGGGVDTDISKLTPEQKTQYDAIVDPAEKAQFLDNAFGKLASGTTDLTKGVSAAAPVVADVAAGLVDQNMSDNNLTQKSVFSIGLKRAGQGAGIGTMIGGPGIGTAIGAGVGALEGGIEGFFGGRKAEAERTAADKAKSDAAALAEKQRRAAAAKANMNPWEIGYGMADGGSIKRSRKESADILKYSQTADSLRKNILDPYMEKYKLKEIPYEKVNELAPGFYDAFGKVASDYATRGTDTRRTDIIKNPQGTNEFGTQGNVPLNKTAYGDLMRSAILPHLAQPNTATQSVIPNATPIKVVPSSVNTSDAPILGLKDGGLTPSKAKEILHDGTVHGKPITDKQRKYFGYISNKLAKGGTVNFSNEEKYKKWLAFGHIHHKFHGKEKISIAGKPHNVDHKAEGGKIEGAGTAKSDSIKAKIKAGSFIVPEENAKLAEEIREKYLGKNKEAKLEQKEGEHVMLSNGEHMFTPEECKHLEEQGVDLDELAPNAEEGKSGKQMGGEVQSEENIKKHKEYETYKNLALSGNDGDDGKPPSPSDFAMANKKMDVSDWARHEGYKKGKEEYNKNSDVLKKTFKGIQSKQDGGVIDGYATGGKVSKKDIEQGIAMKQSELDSIDEQIKKIEEGNKQLDKQIKLPKLKLARVQAENNVLLAQDPTNYEDLGKGIGYSFSPKQVIAQSPVVASAPEIKKATINKGGVSSVGKRNSALTTPIDYMQPTSVSPSGPVVESAVPTTINQAEIPNLQAKAKAGTATPEEKSKLSQYLSNTSNALGGVGGIGGLALAGTQVGLGFNQLNKLGARPEDTGTIDSDFYQAVEQAKNDAKYGISPIERSIAERGIEGTRQADVANITNLANGSAGTALGNIRAASNQAQNNLGKLSAESERLRLEKQRYANSLVGQKASMDRNLYRQKFEDKMNAFNINQQAGAGLLGAGIQNAFGALRYIGANNAANDRSQIGNQSLPE